MHAVKSWSVAVSALFVLGTVLAVPLPTGAESDDVPPLFAPDAATFTLDNGMEVVVIPDRRVPVATHMIWYKVGSADEPAGKSGIAHFLEHLMFKGTPEHPDGEFSRIVAEIGGQENAFTAQDYTGYFQRVAKEHLALMMELEADRMRNLVLTEPAVDTEREVILEERRSRIENDPSGILSEALTAAFYQSHPYGTPIIGWEHEIKALSLEDAITFYERYYSPENAVLVVAGDVSPQEVLSLARDTYGRIERGELTARAPRPDEPAPRAERRVILKDPRVRQPSLQQAYLVPSYAEADGREAEALDLLAEILGSGPTSRIYRSLIVDKKIASSAGAWYQGGALDETRFGLYGTPADGFTLEELEAEIEALVADIAENGVTRAEVDRFRRAMLADAIYAQDSQATLARAFGAALTSGETVADVQEWPRRIMAVTPEDVQAAARRYLDPDIAATGYLLPEDGETRS